jgi:hypothetical protein
VLGVERLVAVTDIVSDVADMAELDAFGVAVSQTLRNMVPKPVPTESIAL